MTRLVKTASWIFLFGTGVSLGCIFWIRGIEKTAKDFCSQFQTGTPYFDFLDEARANGMTSYFFRAPDSKKHLGGASFRNLSIGSFLKEDSFFRKMNSGFASAQRNAYFFTIYFCEIEFDGGKVKKNNFITHVL